MTSWVGALLFSVDGVRGIQQTNEPELHFSAVLSIKLLCFEELPQPPSTHYCRWHSTTVKTQNLQSLPPIPNNGHSCWVSFVYVTVPLEVFQINDVETWEGLHGSDCVLFHMMLNYCSWNKVTSAGSKGHIKNTRPLHWPGFLGNCIVVKLILNVLVVTWSLHPGHIANIM